MASQEAYSFGRFTLEVGERRLPRHVLAREFLASAYLKKGDVERYLAQVMEHAAIFGVPPADLEPLKAAYAAGGRAGTLYCLQQLSINSNAPAFQLAVLSAEVGDTDAAFSHLDRAIGSRDPSLVDLAVAPQWDGLRGDPRFERVARMGLAAGSA